ncbi:MAG: hypothetical protein AAF557_22815 [Pseudomonadota bacterium]
MQSLNWCAAPRPKSGGKLDVCELAILAAFAPPSDPEVWVWDAIERRIDLETARAEDRRRNRLIFIASASGGILGALIATGLVAAFD